MKSSKKKKRRAGIALPSIILLLFILVFALISYLSLIGIPQTILRAAEDAAAKQGYYISLKKARISYFTGFSIQLSELNIYDDEKHQSKAILEIPRCNLGISAVSLFKGEFKPYSIEINEAKINIPLAKDSSKQLKLSPLNISIELKRKGLAKISIQDAKLNGISINLNADILIAEKKILQQNFSHDFQEVEIVKFDLKGMIEKQEEYIEQCYSIIEEQKWIGNQFPQLFIKLRYDKNITCSIRAIIPSYKYEKYQLEHAHLNIDYRNNSIIINRLTATSISPDGTFDLQGGYNILRRQLSLDVKSDLPIIEVLGEHIAEEDKQVLRQVQRGPHAKSNFNISGDIIFTENYQIDKVSLLGKINQRNIQIAAHDIDQLLLSFYYNEGSFAFDKIHIQLDDSYITAAASLHGNLGKLELIVNMYPTTALDIANEFIQPDKPIQLPVGLHLDGKLNIHLKANLSTYGFKPGMKALINSTPNFQGIHLNGSIQRLVYKEHYFHEPQLSLNLDSLKCELGKLPHAIGVIKATIKAKEIKIPHSESNNIAAEHALLNFELNHSDVGKDFDFNNLIIQRASGKLSIKELVIDKNHIKNIQIKLDDLLKFKPLCKQGNHIQSAQAEIKLEQCLIDGKKIEQGHMGISLEGEGTIDAWLRLHLDKAQQSGLNLNANWNLNTGALLVQDIAIEAPASIIPEFFTKNQLENLGLDFAGQLAIHAQLLLQTGDRKHLSQKVILKSGKFTLDIPEVIRRNIQIPSLKDKVNRLSLKAQGDFKRDAQGDYNYKISNLDLAHQSGSLKLKIDGNTDSHLNITGSNSIRADFINQILDLQSAHYIIRDFKFQHNSQVLITNINANINYKHGFKLESEADVQLKRIAYQLNAISDVYDHLGHKTGKEKQRSDLGADPYTHIDYLQCKLDLNIHLDQLNAHGKAIDDISSIKLVAPVIKYNNQPWLDKQRIKGGKKSTFIKGNYVDINIGKSYVLIDGIKGEAYPSYAIGMYFAPLHHILDILELKQPAQLYTEQCIFPIAEDCKEEMQGDISLRSIPAFMLRAADTDFPLSNLSLIIHLSDTYVLLDNLNAILWDGVLNAKARIDFDEGKEGYDGYLSLDNIAFKKLMNSFHVELSPALAQGEIRFRANAFTIDAIEAYGKVSIRNGNLMELGIFSPITELLNNIPAFLSKQEHKITQQKKGLFSRSLQKVVGNISTGISFTGDIMNTTTRFIPGINRLIQYSLQDANASFQIYQGILSSDDLVAAGDNLLILSNLAFRLEDSYLDAEIWPEFSGIAGIALSPVTEISDHIIDINTYGTIDKLKWKISIGSAFSRRESIFKSKKPKKSKKKDKKSSKACP